MLQREAAEVAGCSVSAIRKWRRLGLVADRTRVSSGGMRQVEVRLDEVTARMRDSMPRPRSVPDRAEAGLTPAPAPFAVVPVKEVDVFVHHIAESERRAAQAEARAQASEAMTQFLRNKVADLQAQLERRSGSISVEAPGLRNGIGAVATELRDLRNRLQRAQPAGGRSDANVRLAGRYSYDTALLCLCTALGIPTRFRLGSALTSAERARLTDELRAAGYDVTE